ncbi:MAG: TIGR02281 family clan AA aspartic protease [Paracoccaceae bacterium]
MSGEIAYFVYYAILGFFIGSFVLRAYRGRMGAMLQQMLIWFLIFMAAVIVYGFKDQIQRQLFPSQGVVSVDAISVMRSSDGHFYADMRVNGARVLFVIDTGATDIVLNTQDAKNAGIDLDSLRYIGIAETANGAVRTAQTTLDTLEFSNQIDRNLRVYVSEGQMDISLLGMAYLRRFPRLEIIEDTLFLYP